MDIPYCYFIQKGFAEAKTAKITRDLGLDVLESSDFLLIMESR